MTADGDSVFCKGFGWGFGWAAANFAKNPIFLARS